jgi:hypothetical protein
MQIAIRIVAGLLGGLGALAAILFWFMTDSAAHGIGLDATGAMGLAAVRADIAGFFGAQALFALLTAWTGRAEYALPPVVLMSFALFGRALSIALGGFDPAIVSGMLIEAVCIAIFVVAWRVLRTESVPVG